MIKSIHNINTQYSFYGTVKSKQQQQYKSTEDAVTRMGGQQTERGVCVCYGDYAWAVDKPKAATDSSRLKFTTPIATLTTLPHTPSNTRHSQSHRVSTNRCLMSNAYSF